MRNIRISTWTYNSVGKVKEKHQNLRNHIYCLMQNSQQVLKMFTTNVVAQLTPVKQRLMLEDFWCRINFVRGEKSSGLRSDERGGQVTSPPYPIHCAEHMSFKKLRTLTGEMWWDSITQKSHASLDGERNKQQLTPKFLFQEDTVCWGRSNGLIRCNDLQGNHLGYLSRNSQKNSAGVYKG